jgi:uncharacterized repeat protein (TIGR01451 family)
MAKFHRALFVLCMVLSLSAFGQSADQEILSATDSPDPVIPGNNVTYTVQVRNNGPDAAVNGGLNMNIGGSLNYISASGPAGFTCGNIGNNASCTNPSFPSGATATFTILAQLDPSRLNFPDGTVTSNFFTSGTTADPNNGNNSASVTTAWDSPQIDLSLTVADSPDPVFPNGNITYTIPVTNGGPDTATSVNFNSFNNGSLKFQSATVPAGWNCTLPAVNGTPTFTCTNPSFAPGTSNFTVVVKADPAVLGLNDGTVSTAFSVNGTGNDTNQANNNETEDTAYVTPDADISVTNSDAPDPVVQGGTITYTQSIANGGPDAAPNATFSEILQSSVGFQSISVPAGFVCTTPAIGASGTITCTNPSLASGGGGSITVTVNVIASSGTVTNTIAASSSAQDPDNTDTSATVTTTILAPVTADLGITKTTPSGSATPGASVTYTITLTNNGPDAAANVVVTDVLPAQLLFQSISTPAGFNCTTPAIGANGTITCTAATMANGTTAVFTLGVQVAGNATGTINNNATASSDAADNNSGNNSGSSSPVVVGPAAADLSIAKSTASTQAATGSTITYTISVTNNGPDSATNVVVSDDLPAGLQYVAATPSQGTCSGTDPFTCNLGTLLNGGSATITLQVLVTATTGTISNTATVTSSITDNTPGNNSSSSPALPVTPAAAEGAAGVPTLSEWALLALVAMLGWAAVVRMRG